MGNQSETNVPEKKFSTGAITATIWKNTGKKKDGDEFDYYTVGIDRRYKDGDEWKSSNSFRLNDLPKLGVVCNKAYEYLVLKEQDN